MRRLSLLILDIEEVIVMYLNDIAIAIATFFFIRFAVSTVLCVEQVVVVVDSQWPFTHHYITHLLLYCILFT